MKSLKFIRGAIVALAALGVVFPQLTAIAAGPKSAAKPISERWRRTRCWTSV